jgi:hypothetical protein
MSTGTKDHQLPHFSGDDDPTLYYKPVSTMAVISFLLGIASLGSFFSLGLWVLLPFAIIISSITSFRLERARQEYAGQFISKVAVLLSLVSLVGAPTVFFTKYYLLAAESRTVADQYLDFIMENKLKSAFKLTQSVLTQASTKSDDEMVLRMGREQYLNYLAGPSLRQLGGIGEVAQVTHSGALYEGTSQGLDRVMHQYIVTIDTGKPGEKPLVLSVPVLMQGATSPTGEWEGRKWRVELCNPTPYETRQGRWAKMYQSGG